MLRMRSIKGHAVFGTARITMHLGRVEEAILRHAYGPKSSQINLTTVLVLALRHRVVLEMKFERPSHALHRFTEVAAHLDEQRAKGGAAARSGTKTPYVEHFC